MMNFDKAMASRYLPDASRIYREIEDVVSRCKAGKPANQAEVTNAVKFLEYAIQGHRGKRLQRESLEDMVATLKGALA